MSKRDEYGKIHNVIGNLNFHRLNKHGQKVTLDGWIKFALEVAYRSGEPLTTWEKINFRDAISASHDGLFWLARKAIEQAVMPDQPRVAENPTTAPDLAEITIERLIDAAARLETYPAQMTPVFMR